MRSREFTELSSFLGEAQARKPFLGLYTYVFSIPVKPLVVFIYALQKAKFIFNIHVCVIYKSTKKLRVFVRSIYSVCMYMCAKSFTIHSERKLSCLAILA